MSHDVSRGQSYVNSSLDVYGRRKGVTSCYFPLYIYWVVGIKKNSPKILPLRRLKNGDVQEEKKSGADAENTPQLTTLLDAKLIASKSNIICSSAISKNLRVRNRERGV
jgi:hypothetical protein